MSEIIEDAIRNGVTSLTEAEAKNVLTAAGIPVPEYEVVDDIEGCVSAGSSIGYPVVVKVLSRDIRHKSEWGDGVGVQLDVTDEDELRSAYRHIATADAFGADTRALVEGAADLDEGTEVLISGFRHDSFGPTLVFGLGGIYTEVLDDITYGLAPLSKTEAREMTDDIRGNALLDGFRSKPPVNRDELADLLRRTGVLLVEYPSILEVELNPVLARKERSLALDALLTLAPERDGD